MCVSVYRVSAEIAKYEEISELSLSIIVFSLCLIFVSVTLCICVISL
jgi:hypothetical protein